MRTAGRLGILVAGICAAVLATGTLTSAQGATIERSPWRMLITPAPSGPLSNGHSDMTVIEPYFVDAVVPDANDPLWQPAPEPDTIGFDGQVDPNFGGEQSSRLTTCGSEVDYTYFETIVTVPPGVTPSTFTVDFVNIDDAAQISIFNSANPTGAAGANGVVLADTGGTSTGNLASQLVEGENRVVITQMDFCNPGNTLQEARITLDGEEVPVEEETTTTVEETTTTIEVPDEIPPSSFGDVHFRTPDALVFDIQDAGDFLLSQDSTGVVVIQSRQELHPDRPGVSTNKAIAMTVGADTLEFYAEPQQTLLVNGQETAAPDGALDLPGGGVVTGSITQSAVGDVTTPNDFQVDWPDGATVARVLFTANGNIDTGMVRLGSLDYEGVLGNLDGDAENDMQLRDGDQVDQPAATEDVVEFADSWRVPAAESLFSRGDTPAPAEDTAALVTGEELDPAAVEEATQACEEAGITDDLALETCVYDVAATGDDEFVESSATVEEAVEALPDSAPDPVFATEEPDLVEDDDSSFPWILVGVVVLLVILVVVVIVVLAKGKKGKDEPAPNPPAQQGAGPAAPEG